ncbi:uncharacterized protein LOC135210490 [Macrobrachium nipponense]|uniref:uncharacterized protein LOC135210490 n=1 Tax=Macrobrachium nipponense TaxID=159736 RepID=UPI0030C88720
MRRITNILRLSLLVLISLLAVDGWINQLNLTLCRRDIRCYRKALICERRLRFLELEVFMLRALNECQTATQGGIGPFKAATITDLENVLATAGDDRVRDVARCMFTQLGLWKNGSVDQVAFYYMLSYANISSDMASQEAFLDALSSCPAPELEQMPNFLGCVVQACVQST